MTTIMVVEPHALLRLGILHLLADVVPDVQLKSADYSFLSKPSEDLHSDIVLLSIPSSGVKPLVDAAHQACSPKAIILFADKGGMPTSLPQLPPTVAGFLPKDVPPEVLQASIRLVLAGGSCFPLSRNTHPEPLSLFVDGELPHIDPPTSAVSNTAMAARESELLGLTPRQYEVLVLLAKGHTLKMVARQLNVSAATAKSHADALYQRLNVHGRNEAVYVAVTRGATLGIPQTAGQFAPG